MTTGEQRLGEVEALLAFYGERGYEFRVGPGARPAILVVDFSLAFTRGRGDFPGGDFAPELAATRRLLDTGRDRGVPIAYTTISYAPHMRDAPPKGSGDTSKGSWSPSLAVCAHRTSCLAAIRPLKAWHS